MKKILIVATGMLLLVGSCSKNGGVKFGSAADSMAYIIGMNVGMNLLQMDSTLNADAVCEGIRDVLHGQTLLSDDDARTYYLRQITFEQPEKIRAYENQFLEDIRQDNRSYARSESGLTYTVDEVGNEKFSPSSSRDTVSIRYVMRTADNRQLYSSYERGDTLHSALSGLLKGMQESVKLIGKGGRMQMWIPAAQAYGTAGDEELGVKPNATLFFEVELVDVRKASGR